jgi:hypothetical protein
MQNTGEENTLSRNAYPRERRENQKFEGDSKFVARTPAWSSNVDFMWL